MEINIINNSIKEDEKVHLDLEELIAELNARNVLNEKIKFKKGSFEFAKKITKLNKLNNDLIYSIEKYVNYLSHELFDKNNNFKKIIILMEDAKLKHPYGESNGCISIISNTEKYVIWHETAHIFGAEDHYDEATKEPLNYCLDESCVMRYDNPTYLFCNKSLEEMKSFLDNCKS